MKRLSVFAALTLLAACAAQAEPAAILMGVTGRTEVCPASANAWTIAKPGMALAAGDRVAVRTGRATVLRADGHLELLHDGGSFLTTQTAGQASGRGTLGRLWEALVRRSRQVTGARKMFSEAGAVRGQTDGRLTILAPRNATLLEPPSRIRWETGVSPGPFEISIVDSDSRTVWSDRCSGGQAVLPAAGLGFAAGAFYFIRVSAPGTADAAGEKVYFRLLPAPERVTLERELAAVQSRFGSIADAGSLALARAALFEQHGLLEEAAAAYRKLGDAAAPTAAAGLDWLQTLGGRRRVAAH